jgi:type II secretion system protein G
MKTVQKGFTLIELLIVVAIIAILAAIAVPNFLEAQTRSKVSRAKSDMRTLATGLEAYNVDTQKYPPEYLSLGYPETIRVMKAESHLTTPVAYITSVPLDPFKPEARFEPPVYWFYNWLARYGRLINCHTEFYGRLTPWYNEPAAWCVTSLGPDRDADFPVIYDPTNGTISNGDITRLGPGGGGSR